MNAVVCIYVKLLRLEMKDGIVCGGVCLCVCVFVIDLVDLSGQ